MSGHRLTVHSLMRLAAFLSILIVIYGCGGDGDGGESQNPPQSSGTGQVTVSLSDPPTCKAPGGNLDSVWVTVTLVRAHISNEADPEADGWVNVVDLRDDPVQINLLGTSDTTCILTVLGSTTGLPPGDYQQIRLHLLSNSPGAGEATPSPNHCAAAGGFNCVVDRAGARVQLLRLSSQAHTGLKIPPGRIAGGAISLEARQAADINIDFHACDSIVQQGNGMLRLKPTLHAGEVSLTSDAISGRVVDNNTGEPIPDATVIVMAEQPDAAGIDRVIMQTLADATNGTFILCPLPTGNYDLSIAAISERNTAAVTYNATVTLDVPTGTDMGDVPLLPESGDLTSPGTITGLVTTADAGGNPPGADITVHALQAVQLASGPSLQVTIPLFAGSTPNIATEEDACPTGTKCASYTLLVPASNPMVGTFDATGTTYGSPADGAVSYSVNAQAFIPGSGSLPNCTPSTLSTDVGPDGVTPLTVQAGMVTEAETLSFSNCEPES
jgi:hypothetical protein